ncbi:MAG: acyltransferase family protein [Gemmatimonadota bacterium]
MRVDQEPGYRPDIDGLRAVAVLAVVGYHGWPGRITGGFVGVDVFFVISGFLISGIIIRGIETGTFTFGGFYARRIRRIFPALALVLAAAALIGWWMLLPAEYEQLGRHIAAGALFMSNIQLWTESGYFDTAAESKPLLHLWSLGIEEQFYLLWPFVLVLVWRLAPKGRWQAIAAIAVVSIAANIVLVRSSPSAAFYLPFTRFWELLIGAMIAAWPGGAGKFATGRPMTLRTRNVLAAGGSLLIAASVLRFHRDIAFPGWWALLPAGGTAALIIAGPTAWINRRLLSLRPVVVMGLLSYPLYLWHWPLLSFIRVADLDPETTRNLKLGALAFSLLAAWLTWRFLEQGLRRRPAGRVAIPIAGVMAAVAALGVVVDRGPRIGPHTELAVNPFIRVDSLDRNAACSRRFAMPERFFDSVFCNVAGSGDPDVVLLGDSHAAVLWPGVADVHRMQGALLIGGRSCPYVRGTRAWTAQDPGNRERCPIIMDAAWKTLEGRPRTVILMTRWPYYIDGGYGPVEHDQDPRFISDDQPGVGAFELFRTGIERELRNLLAAGHRVFYVQPLPELGFDPRRCLRLRVTDRLREGQDACSISRGAFDRRHETVRSTAREVADRIASERLTIIDPATVLCDETSCHAMLEGIVLYRDDDHLSVAGSQYLWRKLMADSVSGGPGRS